MNLTQKSVSFLYALVVIASACFAGFEIFGFAFAIGDGGGKVGLGTGAFLIGTLVGAVGLLIAASGFWARSRTLDLIAVVSAFLVLPAAVLFCWNNGRAQWHNSQIGFQYGAMAWASVILPIPLNLTVLLWSGLRFRQWGSSVREGSSRLSLREIARK